MGCCIAIASLIALVRPLWVALAPGRDRAAALFAPLAHRTGPDAAWAVRA